MSSLPPTLPSRGPADGGELTYPSIDGPAFAHLGQPCVAFEKYDGSNLRFFWDHKRGWHSTGTRYRWFKAATPTFGVAVEMFQKQYSKGVLDVLRRHKEYRGVTELVAFCEFFGPNTFSGLHAEEDKQLVLFDLHLSGRGFVPPKDFAAHFGHLPIARVVYEGDFTREFVQAVQRGEYGVREGVVAKGTFVRRAHKGQADREVWMAKIKTAAWLDELRRRAGESEEMRKEYEQNCREQQLPEPQDERAEP